MRERNALQRELADLRIVHPLREAESLASCAAWTKDATISGKFSATLTHADAGTTKVPAVYYEGATPDIAVVLGGVHGSEPHGTDNADQIITDLDLAYKAGKKTRCTTVVIRDLFEEARQNGAREVGKIEPNRNFPLPGETYAEVKKRGGKLLDPDQRRNPGKSPPQVPPKEEAASDAMLPENIILVTFLECIKPKRLISIHAHFPKARSVDPLTKRRKSYGDEAGLFVDPRGGFDPAQEAPLAKLGRADDMLTDAMLQAAAARIQAATFGDFPDVKRLQTKVTAAKDAAARAAAETKLTRFVKSMRTHLITAAFAGNVPDEPIGATVTFQTVHYAFSAPRVRGSSLGLWAPAANIATLTLEHPQPSGKITNPKARTDATAPKHLVIREDIKAEQRAFLIKLWAAVIEEKFLGLPP